MRYIFRSPVGILWIRERVDGRFEIGVDGDEPEGSYDSPREAAEEFRLQSTGIPEWDRLRGFTVPTSLTDWERIR